MNNRTSTLIFTLVALICGLYIFNSFILGHFFTNPRTVRTDVLQGILIGYGLALVIIFIYSRTKAVKKINGWTTMDSCGEPGNGMLLRAAQALIFPGPVNVPAEAVYWTTSRDSGGRRLRGRNQYLVHFPAGGLPPNDAFWSLTMGDARNHFVANPIDRYSVSDRTGLAQNADGSVDIYIQDHPPAGHESNWLPAPSADFVLWLRVYLPGSAIRDGQYQVPPVVEVK